MENYSAPVTLAGPDPGPATTFPSVSASARAESGSCITGTWASLGGAPTTAPAPSASSTPKSDNKRIVCDHCRRRRIRCDGRFPCGQCRQASLGCKRDHVPRKRGPKRGHGRVINQLRAEEGQDSQRNSRESSTDLGDRSTDGGDNSAPQTAPNSVPSSPRQQCGQWTPPSPVRGGPESSGIHYSDQYRPLHKNYFWLVRQCIDLYEAHLYPIMPLLYMPTLREMVNRQLTFSEKNLIFALCAFTCLHMSGKSIRAKGPDSWESAGRWFLDECISVRQSYDFFEDESLYAVMSSFWLSTSFFEINNSHKSWMYLREALALALDLKLDDDSAYVGLRTEEQLCRLRVFWILFVTERSYAVLRNKPITLQRTPSLPTARHPYEEADIQSGFTKLISSYLPLEESFVGAWNDISDPRISKSTYVGLQDILSRPPAFLVRSRATTPSSDGSGPSIQDIITPTSTSVPASIFQLVHNAIPTKTEADEGASGLLAPAAPVMPPTEDVDPDPTEIQQADLLITQQWLRLIVWRSSEQRKFLSWSSQHESMGAAFPLEIARKTVSILSYLSSAAVEVHGMGIFEKIFKIGIAYVDALSMCDSVSAQGMGRRLGMGMDFANGHLDVLGTGRKGFTVDPLEFFVKTLSSTPNSQTKFAEELIRHASSKPGGMRLSLSPPMNRAPAAGSFPLRPHVVMQQPWNASSRGLMPGTVLGEVDDNNNVATLTARVKRSRTSVTADSGMTLPMQYSHDLDDIGLVSPSMPDHQGFGVAVPGIASETAWQTVIPPAITNSWASVGTSDGVHGLDAFSFGPTLTSDEFAYGTFDAHGSGSHLSEETGLHRGNQTSTCSFDAGTTYGRFQAPSALGAATVTPVGDSGEAFGLGVDSNGHRRKRVWEVGNWV